MPDVEEESQILVVTQSTTVKRQANNIKLETETTQKEARLKQDGERQDRLDAQVQRQAHLWQRETPHETLDIQDTDAQAHVTARQRETSQETADRLNRRTDRHNQEGLTRL